jgi:hypothetical protein
VTADRIINENTLAPMMRPFLCRDKYTQLRSYMSGSDLKERLGMIKYAHEKQDGLRYCAFCAQEDRIFPGEAYWHRLHQSSVVQVCPKHYCYLSCAPRQKQSAFSLTLAQEAIPITEPIKMANPNDPYDALLLWMSRQVQWLLRHTDAELDIANLSASYMQGLYFKGLLTLRGKPDLGRIREQFCKVVGDHIRHSELFDTVYHANSIRSLNRAIQSLGGHPGLHFLLMYFLGVDVESLPMKSKFFHFEPGPWPCLSPACGHYESEVIHDYFFRADQHGAQVANFRCECGYAYARQAPDFEGKSRLRPHRIISTGDLWNREFQGLWSRSDLQIPVIAAKLRCSTTHIRKMISILGVPSRKNRKKIRRLPLVESTLFDEKRTASRTKIAIFRNNNPNAGRTDFHRYAPREMQWLLKSDRDWLEGILPKAKKWGSKVDWEGRDREYAKRVESAKKGLIASQGTSTFRVTAERLMNALRLNPRNARRGYYPNTYDAVQAAAETSEQYRVRKLYWILKNPNSELPSTFAALLNRVEIRLEMRTRPSVIEAIEAAKEHYQQKKNGCAAVVKETAA